MMCWLMTSVTPLVWLLPIIVYLLQLRIAALGDSHYSPIRGKQLSQAASASSIVMVFGLGSLLLPSSGIDQRSSLESLHQRHQPYYRWVLIGIFITIWVSP